MPETRWCRALALSNVAGCDITAECGDGQDNDCDGSTDCADSDCNGDSCGSFGMECSGGVCECSGNGGNPQATETFCWDWNDNDCNGTIDCDDPNCDGMICDFEHMWVCNFGVCGMM